MHLGWLVMTIAISAIFPWFIGQVAGQTVEPSLVSRQEEIWKTAKVQAEKYNSIHVSYTQTYSSGSQSVKCRVFVSPDGVLAESDLWLLAVTPTRAFALAKYKGRFTLLGLEDYSDGEARSARVAKVAKNFGGNGSHLLPFEATGFLAILPSTVMFRVAELTSSQKSTPVTNVQDGLDDRTVVAYKITRPPGVDVVQQGRAVDVDGTLSLDKSASFRLVTNEMRTVSSRTNAVMKETVQYQVPLPDLGLSFMKTYERIRTSGDSKNPDKIRVEYGGFRAERLDPARLLLEHYDLVPPTRISGISWISWMVWVGVALVFLVVGSLVYRRISARDGQEA